MGGKLLFKAVPLLLLLLTLLLPFFIDNKLSAQVPVTDTRQFDLSFTENRTQSSDRFLRLSVTDLQRVLGEAYSMSPERFDGQVTRSGDPMFVTDSGNTALIGLRPYNSSEFVFSDLSFVNRTGKSFDALTIAFDFLYRSVPENGSFRLQLQSKTVNGSWNDVRGGVISSEELQDTDGEWHSFSIQAHTDELFLRDNDVVRLRWVHPDSTDITNHPLAIQQVELSPTVSARTAPPRGSIIISELLVTTQTAVGQLEYIEFYNPTEEPVNLKGVVIETPNGESLIGRELIVEPYSFIVLSSDLVNGNNFINSGFEYGRSLLGERSGGHVRLSFEESEIARATYENAEPGTALQLGRISSSYDGYTSLQDLSHVTETLSTNVRGTPGRAGSAVRLYSRLLNNEGWHLVSSPGQMVPSLNRTMDSEFVSLMGQPFRMQDTAPGEPFLIYRESSEPYRLFAEEARIGSSDFNRFDIDGNTSLVTLNRPDFITLNSLGDELGRPVSPALLSWDADRQTFRVVHRHDEVLSGWSPLAINSRAPVPSRLIDTDQTSDLDQLEGYLNLKLFLSPDRGTSRIPADETVIGFMEKQRMNNGVRFDLPRLFPLTQPDEDLSPITMMYLSNPESQIRSNSFTHLPSQLEQPYIVGLGTFSNRDNEQALLDWSEADNIPDEWTITLEDRVTGARIDMRDQTSYNFRLLTNRDRDLTEMTREPFTMFMPDSDDRFQITIKPQHLSGDLSSGESSTGSVELRPNYPNPFNPATNIVFHLPEERQVRLGIYNIVGQQIALLADDVMGSGDHAISWNATDHPSGIYIVQLETGNRIYTRKITLIK